MEGTVNAYYMQNFVGGDQLENAHLEDLEGDGRILC
jgi:hypothetical protein